MTSEPVRPARAPRWIGGRGGRARPAGVLPPPPGRRRVPRLTLDQFARPLASDDGRASYWARHLRLGVGLSQAAAVLVLVYVWVAHRPGADVTSAIFPVVVTGTLLLLRVPIRSWSRDLRGVVFFYVWSVVMTAVIVVVTVLDGGADSPLLWLLVLTLTYAGLAYPPGGVIAMGGVMVGADLVILLAGTVRPEQALVQVGALVLLTAMIASASRNQWDLVDSQLELTTRLSTLASTDSLTLCLNRREFDRILLAAAEEASESSPLSLCMVDLDGFKQVNDIEGHAEGDALLARIAARVRAATRDGDAVGRMGGDEFAVLLPATPVGSAFEVAERIRVAVSASGGPHGVTASLGVATAESAAEARKLLNSADQLMYGAKRAGGDLAQLAGGSNR